VLGGHVGRPAAVAVTHDETVLLERIEVLATSTPRPGVLYPTFVLIVQCARWDFVVGLNDIVQRPLVGAKRPDPLFANVSSGIAADGLHKLPVDAVVTNDKRRWPRDENEVMRFVADLRDRDVELHTHLNGQVDLSDPMDAAMEIMRASVAAEEKREEIQKAREAVEQRVSDPAVDHGRPRFGMTYDDRGDRQVPGEEFETVEEILRLRDRGLSIPDISERTDVPTGTVYRVCDREEWYRERAAGKA
jgi:DNA invertase Pin-like site-specific DNA recombinase